MRFTGGAVHGGRHTKMNTCSLLLLVCCFAWLRPLSAESQCAWDTHMSPSKVSGKNTRRLIDISVTIHPDLPCWDKSEGLGAHRELIERRDEGGVAFVSKLTLVVHTGTHFDAPSHFLQEAFDSGRGIEAVQLSVMNGSSVRPRMLLPYSCHHAQRPVPCCRTCCRCRHSS